MHLRSMRHKSPKAGKIYVHVYEFCITSSTVSCKPHARPITRQYPLVTAPHSIYGMSDPPEIEVVPGVP